jgi:hypothetical protein
MRAYAAGVSAGLGGHVTGSSTIDEENTDLVRIFIRPALNLSGRVG